MFSQLATHSSNNNYGRSFTEALQIFLSPTPLIGCIIGILGAKLPNVYNLLFLAPNPKCATNGKYLGCVEPRGQ